MSAEYAANVSVAQAGMDRTLLGAAGALVVLGLVMVASSSITMPS